MSSFQDPVANFVFLWIYFLKGNPSNDITLGSRKPGSALLIDFVYVTNPMSAVPSDTPWLGFRLLQPRFETLCILVLPRNPINTKDLCVCIYIYTL